MYDLTRSRFRSWPVSAASLLAFVAIAAALSISAMAQQPGSLDPTFSGDGKLIDGIWHNSEDVQGVAVQSDGKIVAVGSSFDNYLSGEFALARYNPDGSLDTSFGGDGLVITRIGAQAQARSVAIQSDGKIVTAGYGNGKFAVVRYNPDGSQDASFDGDGVALASFGAVDEAFSVAIQSNGKIVVAGRSTAVLNSSNYDLAIARYNSDGSLDATFDEDGKVITPAGTNSAGIGIYSIAIQSDGKIVAGGWGDFGDGFGLVRYNADGSLDASFDGDGKVSPSFGTSQFEIDSVAIQTDGKIVAAGTDHNGSPGSAALFRYNANGSLDTSFDGDGRAGTPFLLSETHGDRAVAVLPNGKIVVTAHASSGRDFRVAISRYNGDGSLDTSFGVGGLVLTSIGTGYFDGDDAPVAIQPDGKVVVAGSGLNGSGGDFVLGRYNMDGSPDNSFDGDGTVRTDFGLWTGNYLLDVAVQQDGKILVVGNALARYNPDGTPDTSFGGTGKVALPLGAIGYAVAIQPNGKAVVAGQLYEASCDCENIWLARYNSDGSPDTSFGTDGEVTTYLMVESSANSVAIQADGKIVASAGNTFTVVRYNTDGSLDASFDGDGIVTTAFGPGAEARSIAVQPDGKIVAAGVGGDSFSQFRIALARYNTDGSLDSSFGGGGKVTAGFGGVSYANSVAVQPDGKVVAAGYIDPSPGLERFAVVRFNTNGSLDTSFDGDGIVLTSVSSDLGAASVAIQADGKILASGPGKNGADYDFALVRYTTTGSLDTTFGGDGISTVDLQNGAYDQPNGLAIDGQGRAVVVGQSDGAFAIARFLLEASSPTAFDFDGDGRTDLAVRRPSDNIWYFLRTSAGYTGFEYGISGDLITPADFDGDGKTDVAVFRPSSGVWYIAGSSSGFYTESWGEAGDMPVPADYDGDGKADPAVFRPSNGTWYMKRSTAGLLILQFGTAEDKPQIGDYDGDGKADLCVRRPSDNTWYFLRSTAGFTGFTWGVQGDIAAPADFDGDGKTDVAVFRPSTGVWYVAGSTRGFMTQAWGTQGDIPVAADYDGDGKADVAVYRPSDRTWYVFRSTAGLLVTQFGTAEDKPVHSAFSF